MHNNLEATTQQQLTIDSTLNDDSDGQPDSNSSESRCQVTLQHSAAEEQALQAAAYSPGPGYQFIGADRPHQPAVA
jgi:hypothetical protein